MLILLIRKRKTGYRKLRHPVCCDSFRELLGSLCFLIAKIRLACVSEVVCSSDSLHRTGSTRLHVSTCVTAVTGSLHCYPWIVKIHTELALVFYELVLIRIVSYIVRPVHEYFECVREWHLHSDR